MSAPSSAPASPTDAPAPARIVSLDAYRGFVMLAMVSGGFAFTATVHKFPEVRARFDGTTWALPWTQLWDLLAYQFEHVPWVGCAAWDLIQPSFMFLVGAAMPFSYAVRQSRGDGWWKTFAHALWRSALLIALGVFLRSNGAPQTNFTFVDVLTQIGLGYPILFLLQGRRVGVQVAALAAILIGYGWFFARYEIPADEKVAVTTYLREQKKLGEAEWTQHAGFAAHWNKHVNAAAAVDRRFLNRLPLYDPEWRGERFWVNLGGYQTLNFVPSIATMLLGLMAGQMLQRSQGNRSGVGPLLLAGLACFGVALAADTTIWPFRIPGCEWSLCPTVKRIWTPTWVLFSGGWTFWTLAAFHWAIDVRGWRRWAFPLVVVGMNSIAMYVMDKLFKGWIASTLKTHLKTIDVWFGTQLWAKLFAEDNPYARMQSSVVLLLILWLMCWWLYRRRIFLRI